MDNNRLVSIVLASAIISSSGVEAASVGVFRDMPNNWAGPSLKTAVGHNLLQGYNGEIKPYGELTRAEMATIVSRMLGLKKTADLRSYKDMYIGKWYYNEMAKAVEAGLIEGWDSQLYPDRSISREEAFLVLARVLDFEGVREGEKSFKDQADISNWSESALNALANLGHIQGDGQGDLKPKNAITRAEFAVLMNNLVKNYIQQPTVVENKEFKGNLIVNSRGVSFFNTRIDGDLILAEGVGEDSVELDNVEIKGNLVVRSASELDIKNSSLSRIKVLKPYGDLTLKLDRKSSVARIDSKIKIKGLDQPGVKKYKFNNGKNREKDSFVKEDSGGKSFSLARVESLESSYNTLALVFEESLSSDILKGKSVEIVDKISGESFRADFLKLDKNRAVFKLRDKNLGDSRSYKVSADWLKSNFNFTSSIAFDQADYVELFKLISQLESLDREDYKEEAFEKLSFKLKESRSIYKDLKSKAEVDRLIKDLKYLESRLEYKEEKREELKLRDLRSSLSQLKKNKYSDLPKIKALIAKAESSKKSEELEGLLRDIESKIKLEEKRDEELKIVRAALRTTIEEADSYGIKSDEARMALDNDYTSLESLKSINRILRGSIEDRKNLDSKNKEELEILKEKLRKAKENLEDGGLNPLDFSDFPESSAEEISAKIWEMEKALKDKSVLDKGDDKVSPELKMAREELLKLSRDYPTIELSDIDRALETEDLAFIRKKIGEFKNLVEEERRLRALKALNEDLDRKLDQARAEGLFVSEDDLNRDSIDSIERKIKEIDNRLKEKLIEEDNEDKLVDMAKEKLGKELDRAKNFGLLSELGDLKLELEHLDGKTSDEIFKLADDLRKTVDIARVDRLKEELRSLIDRAKDLGISSPEADLVLEDRSASFESVKAVIETLEESLLDRERELVDDYNRAKEDLSLAEDLAREKGLSLNKTISSMPENTSQEIRAKLSKVNQAIENFDREVARLEKELSQARKDKLSELQQNFKAEDYLKSQDEYRALVREVEAEIEAFEFLEEIRDYSLELKFSTLVKDEDRPLTGKGDPEVLKEFLSKEWDEKLLKELVESFNPGKDYKSNDLSALYYFLKTLKDQDSSLSDEELVKRTEEIFKAYDSSIVADSYEEMADRVSKDYMDSLEGDIFKSYYVIDFQESIDKDKFFKAFNKSFDREERDRAYLLYGRSSTSYMSMGNKILYTINYDENIEDLLRKKKETEEKARSVVKSFSLDRSNGKDIQDAEKALRIHDYLINFADYNVEGKNPRDLDEKVNNHSAYGVLVKGSGVCESYAKAFQLLAKEMSLDSLYLKGYAGELHAWNIVKIGQEWYRLDATWDDPTYGDPSHKRFEVQYRYFLTNEAFKESHREDSDLDSNMTEGNKNYFELLLDKGLLQLKDIDGNNYEYIRDLDSLRSLLQKNIDSLDGGSIADLNIVSKDSYSDLLDDIRSLGLPYYSNAGYRIQTSSPIGDYNVYRLMVNSSSYKNALIEGKNRAFKLHSLSDGELINVFNDEELRSKTDFTESDLSSENYLESRKNLDRAVLEAFNRQYLAQNHIELENLEGQSFMEINEEIDRVLKALEK